MLGGVLHQGGLPDQPVWVTRFGGVSFACDDDIEVKSSFMGTSDCTSTNLQRGETEKHLKALGMDSQMH